MRSKLAIIGLTIALFLGSDFVEDRAHARTSVSFNLFFDTLAPYGNWVPVSGYGYGWRPIDVGPYWKPYRDGYWGWSDQGWLWISYEPWGWATYHYGRWVFDDYYGWIWIPGVTWAPAWVSWYESPGYIGWSPLPPDNNFFLEIGISIGGYGGYYGGYYPGYRNYHRRRHKKHHYYDNDYYAPREHCVFVPQNKFGHHNTGLVEVSGPHNLTVIRNVKNVTNIKVVNNGIINYGPDKDRLERSGSGKFSKVNLVDRDLTVVRGRQDINKLEAGTYKVYRPKIEKKGDESPFSRPQYKNKISAQDKKGLPERNYLVQQRQGTDRSPSVYDNGNANRNAEEYGIIRSGNRNNNRGLSRNIETKRETGSAVKNLRRNKNGAVINNTPEKIKTNYTSNGQQKTARYKDSRVNVSGKPVSGRPVAKPSNYQQTKNRYANPSGSSVKKQASSKKPINRTNNYNAQTSNTGTVKRSKPNANTQQKYQSQNTRRSSSTGTSRYSNPQPRVQSNYSSPAYRGNIGGGATYRSYNSGSYAKTTGRK